MLTFFWFAGFCVVPSFAIIFRRKRELVALLLLSFICLVTLKVMWLFLMVSWVVLQHVNVIFHLLTYFFLLVPCLIISSDLCFLFTILANSSVPYQD